METIGGNWVYSHMKPLPQPLDRAAITLMAVLAVLIGLVLWSGDRTRPQVRDFSWQNKQVGVENTAFILEFNRPMDWSQIDPHLQIQPDLPGKLSWSGRRLAYTLTEPIPYGEAYQLQLADVPEANRGGNNQPKIMRPFSGQFRSRDRAFVYLGVSGEEAGRLVLENLSQGQKTILTPPDLVVMDFEPYPLGDRILFSGNDRQAQEQGDSSPQLYTVATGLQVNAPDFNPTPETAAGETELILDNRDYQILKFDLSADGNRIVLQRAPREGTGLGSVSFWQIQNNGSPQLLENIDGGDFLIAPDSQTLVIAQGQGLALLPLDGQQTGDPLDFLPKFGMVMSFAQDGTAATMLKFNLDFTRSLFLVTNQGTQKELLKTKGSVLSNTFGPRGKSLYCILTRLKEGDEYIEEPYLVRINLATGKQTTLLDLGNQRDIHISLAPDGSALLFDQAISDNQANSTFQTEQGEGVLTSTLWMLPLSNTFASGSTAAVAPEAIASGLVPKWLP